MTEPSEQFIADKAVTFVSEHRSLMMATLGNASDSNPFPLVSHVPFAIADDGRLLILVSQLSQHTQHLLESNIASVMIIENAQADRDPFARVRIILDATTTEIDRSDATHSTLMKRLHERLGNTVEILAQLPDFHLIALQVRSATFIRGFAQAHVLEKTIIQDVLTRAV